MKLRLACTALAAALCLTGLSALAAGDMFERQTPRSSMLGYLKAGRAGDFERAAQYLDLRRIPPVERAERGPELARHLKVVLDQTLWVDVEALSEEEGGNADDGLPKSRDRVGEVRAASGVIPILMQRVPREGDGAPIWKISSSVVASVPELYEEFGYGPMGEVLPRAFFESQLLEVQLWQWIALLLLATLAYASAWLIASLGRLALRPVVGRTDSDFDDKVLAATLGPARLVGFVAFFTLATHTLGLAVPVQRVLNAGLKATTAIAATWLLMRLVDVVSGVVESRYAARGAPAHQFVPLGRKFLKGFLAVIAIVATLDSFGFNVTALIAGLGVGGLAVALAAQKTLENLFGGISLLADRPVRVGEICRFGDQLGIVEEIGLRSTRVRTLDRTVITVPNATFSDLQIENLAVRDRMRLKTVIGVRYETTPAQLRRLLEDLRSVLRSHPRVCEDPCRVRMVGFGASSLDIEVYAYVDTPDWNEYLEVREELYLQMMDAVERAGTGFAFPSQTLYLAKDDGIAGPPEARPSP